MLWEINPLVVFISKRGIFKAVLNVGIVRMILKQKMTNGQLCSQFYKIVSTCVQIIERIQFDC